MSAFFLRRLADDGDEAHATTGRAAQVVGEAELGVVDLTRASLAAELEPHLVHHPQARSADGVAEALEAAVRVDRLRALEVEAAIHDVLPCLAARREAE